jgi:hypothetical protein
VAWPSQGRPWRNWGPLAVGEGCNEDQAGAARRRAFRADRQRRPPERLHRVELLEARFRGVSAQTVHAMDLRAAAEGDVAQAGAGGLGVGLLRKARRSGQNDPLMTRWACPGGFLPSRQVWRQVPLRTPVVPSFPRERLLTGRSRWHSRALPRSSLTGAGISRQRPAVGGDGLQDHPGPAFTQLTERHAQARRDRQPHAPHPQRSSAIDQRTGSLAAPGHTPDAFQRGSPGALGPCPVRRDLAIALPSLQRDPG